MTIATVRAPQPETRRGRPARQPHYSHRNNNNPNSLLTERLQLLARRYGVRGELARAIAVALWGEEPTDG